MTNSRPTKRKNDYKIFRSHPDTVPYNQLTEEEKIAEGTRQPFVQTPDFSKDKKEKKYLKKLKFKNKNYSNTSGSLNLGCNGALTRVTIHLKNNRARNEKGDNKFFATTHTFYSRKPEVDAFAFARNLHTEVQHMFLNGKKVK